MNETGTMAGTTARGRHWQRRLARAQAVGCIDALDQNADDSQLAIQHYEQPATNRLAPECGCFIPEVMTPVCQC